MGILELPREVEVKIREIADIEVNLLGHDVIHYKKIAQTVNLYDDQTKTFDLPVTIKGIVRFEEDTKKLKALGLFVEGQLPILGVFKYADNVSLGDVLEINFELDLGTVKANKFDVVDVSAFGRDITVKSVFRLAPVRRLPI